MSMSLKDALLKAGIKTAKVENERKLRPKKDIVKSEIHQSMRNFCEVCQTTQPDVERFNHRMPTVDAQWICSNCADKNQIHDKFRVTEQSQFAKTNRYRRFYGPTLKLENPASPSGAKQNIHRTPLQQERDKQARERKHSSDQGSRNYQSQNQFTQHQGAKKPSSSPIGKENPSDDDDDNFNR
jgi:hypothetical protein